jgi:hypothetical protein
MKAKVLEGVPRVGYDKHLCPFPGSLHSVLTFLGETPDYDYLMGVTGAALRRFWQRDDGGNVDLMYLAPEPYERVLKALGWTFRDVQASDEKTVRDAIIASIDAGRPVLAFGIIGPPECGIVTGYEADGTVLRGWSYFQDPAVEGYYAQTDWFAHGEWAGGLAAIVLGERTDRPSDRDTLIPALEWAVSLERTPVRPERPDHVSGLAAYGAWADALEVDADYPLDNGEVLATRLMVHGDQCVMLEERRNAANFLRWGAGVLPEVCDELCAAARHYDEAANQMPRVWLWGGEMGPAEAQGLADPATRPGIAAGIRDAAAWEARGVECLEAALAKVKG